jgi:dGTP triphosphohydrolase
MDKRGSSVASCQRVFTEQVQALVAVLACLRGCLLSGLCGSFRGVYLFELEATVAVRFGLELKATFAASRIVGSLSRFIGRYITATRLRVPTPGQTYLNIPMPIQNEVAILKQITRRYIFTTPGLLGQQRGQERLLTELFDDLHPVGSEKYLPRRFEYLLQGGHSRARRVADCISGLTEAETIALYRRLRGHESGSLLDPIVR